MFGGILVNARRHSRHLSNVGAFLITRFIAIGLYAVSLPVFINRTSDAAYGVIAIGFSFIAISQILDVAVGYVVAQSIGRRLARTSRKHLKLFNTLFWVYFLCAATLAILLVFIFMNVELSEDERNLFIWIGLLLPSLATSGIVAAIFQANNSLLYLNASRFIFEAGKSAALIISALLFAEPGAVGPILFVVVVLRAALDLRELKVRLGYHLYPPNFKDMFRFLPLLKLGLPSLWMVLLSLFVNIGDKLLIAQFFSKTDVAYYSLAFDVNTKAYLILGAINSAMYAAMIRNHALRRSSSAQIQIGLVAVATMGLLYYLPLALFSKKILSLWVSPEFGVATAHLVPIFSLASLAYLCANVFETSLLAKGLSVNLSKIYCVAVLIYFITLLLLVNLIGLSSFAWAYVVMNIILLIGVLIKYRSYSINLMLKTSPNATGA